MLANACSMETFEKPLQKIFRGSIGIDLEGFQNLR